MRCDLWKGNLPNGWNVFNICYMTVLIKYFCLRKIWKHWSFELYYIRSFPRWSCGMMKSRYEAPKRRETHLPKSRKCLLWDGRMIFYRLSLSGVVIDKNNSVADMLRIWWKTLTKMVIHIYIRKELIYQEVINNSLLNSHHWW